MNENALNNLRIPIFILIILLAISFISIFPVLNMVILGAMLAYGIRPVTSKIQTKLKFPSLSIIISILLIVIPIIIVLIYMLFEAMGLMSSFLSAGGFSIGTGSSHVQNIILQNLPFDIQNMIQPYLGGLNEKISQIFGFLINRIIEWVKDIPGGLIKIFVLICSIYYFIKDGDKIWDYVFTFIPNNQKNFFDNLFNDVGEVLKSIFYGHFLTAVIIGIMAAVGYYILGYPFILFMGVATAFFQFLPVLGPWIVYLSLVAYDVFVTGNIPRAVITLLFGFVLSISDMYIRPALTSRYVDVHPLILIIGFLAGPLTLGLIGFILGPLILGVTYAVISSIKKEIDMERSKEEDSSQKSEMGASVLDNDSDGVGFEDADLDGVGSGDSDLDDIDSLCDADLDDIDSLCDADLDDIDSLGDEEKDDD